MNRRLFLSMFAAPYLGKILPARAVPAPWIVIWDCGTGEKIIDKVYPVSKDESKRKIKEAVEEADLELTRLYAKMLKEKHRGRKA